MSSPISPDSGHVVVSGTVTVSNLPATQPVSGTVTANAGTNLNTSALALEAGHLATIDTSTARIPAQGQALAAASMPVVLTAAQVTTLTPPAAITGFALDATLTGGTQKTKVVDGGGVNALAVNASGQIALSNFPASQAITAASLPIPAGAALDATLTGGTQVARATVAGNIGQQLSAASLPVVTASDQAEIYYARGARQVQETRLLAEQDVARQSYSTRTNDRVGFLLQRGGR